MTETFEVGQRVKAFGTSEGEITYGPFSSTFGGYVGYVVRIAGVEKLHKAAELTSIPEPPKFTVGDVVTLATRAGAKATVEYGPFDDRDVYVVKLVEAPDGDDNPRTFTAMAHVMTKVVEPGPVKVGDRVRVLYAHYADQIHGKLGTVSSTSERWTPRRDALHPYRVEVDGNSYWVRDLERVEVENTYTYDGVTYDLTAQYRDRDGDRWELRRSPDRGGVVEAQMTPVEDDEWGHYTLSTLVGRYGPLTRI